VELAEVEVNEAPKPDKRLKAKFWQGELKASDKMLEKWHKQGNKINKRYLDDRERVHDTDRSGHGGAFKLNLFHANVLTLEAMLYGSLPKIDVSRKNQDANDDAARVASEMMERLLNLDMQNNAADWDSVLRSTLQDRLLPGLGVAKVRYEFEEEQVEVAAVVDAGGFVMQEAYTDSRIVKEEAPVDYFHWQDVRWGWGRSFADLPWIAFRSYLTKDKAYARFGEDICKQMEFKTLKVASADDEENDPDEDSPWQMAEVWEIWDKETKKVIWYSPGVARTLDKKDDPLGLTHFFPCAPFMIANATTSLYKPTPDYYLSQDLYNEVDRLQTRIAIITKAVKVVGVYDASAEGVERMFQEGVDNDLIPVDNWAMLGEKGGLQGVIDWFPIADVVSSLDKLRALRDETMGLLQQITGMADVMQGSVNPYEGVGQTQIKAQFGSVRVQSLQDQFATFAADTMQIKAEVICKHFEPESIIKMSGMEYSFDQQLLMPAVELLKQPNMARIRIQIRPETMAMIDHAKLKVERSEFINAMATFLQSATPLVEREPATTPFLLQMLQWGLAGFKGSQEIEGVMDQAIKAATEAAQQPKEDEAQKAEQAKQQAELAKIQAKAQADMQLRQQDMQADIQTARAAHQAKMAEIAASSQAKLQEIQSKMRADLQVEQAETEANIAQNQATAQNEIMKDAVAAELEMETKARESELKLNEMTTQSLSKIDEMALQSTLSQIEMEGQAEEGEDDD